ncbi:hypothetical protein GGD41_007365 [Paraburkholderia bryophila]|uniref:Uncharacterized protein n=1 Tax=Paraburkholderia bryophila TaxID=420952 RepID=A0A7Z0B584_9BURK|nr:hypothetical protein [Paraburkholderia bryophila]
MVMACIRISRRLSVFIGRTIPGVGWVLLARDAFIIATNTVFKYHRMVKAEDKVL